ncbi:MAG: hypothetical protein F6K28_19860 [Microcoleus sp. SIO2G3]|nr:hypothetical protein [Microcoleus sp. SIO2G3]
MQFLEKKSDHFPNELVEQLETGAFRQKCDRYPVITFPSELKRFTRCENK